MKIHEDAANQSVPTESLVKIDTQKIKKTKPSKIPTLPEIPADRPRYDATPAPTLGVVSWNMNTTCNYRCTYCTQRFIDDRGRWAKDVPRFIAGFAKHLVGQWEIKMSGGEPFLHPEFLDIVRALRQQNHLISVVTNFSSKWEKLAQFIDAANTNLRTLSCSLHLEYNQKPEALQNFIDKCRQVLQVFHTHPDLYTHASLCVTCVATRDNLPILADLQKRFQENGIVFKVQPEKQGREVIDYAPHEIDQLIALGGHNQTGNIAPDFGGQPCWAGSKYFILDDQGQAYRCYPARRYRFESLGNFLDDSFQLNLEAKPCLYRYCNCTVPIARNMMPIAAAVDKYAHLQLSAEE